MASTFLLGSTGMVGSHILSVLRSSPSITSIDTIARRTVPSSDEDSKTTSFVDADTTKWGSHIQSLKPAPQIYFCAFGTTRAAAGGFDKQYKIEHDLNIELAKEAKQAGFKVFVLISSASANKDSRVGYTHLKGAIEEDIKALDFDHTVILRPGLIAGNRGESRPLEAVLRKVAGFAGALNNGLKDFWAQDADIIAKAAVNAGTRALNGEAPERVWIVGQSDIVRLGRTEWKE